jgi:hypothetical protein
VASGASIANAWAFESKSKKFEPPRRQEKESKIEFVMAGLDPALSSRPTRRQALIHFFVALATRTAKPLERQEKEEQ